MMALRVGKDPFDYINEIKVQRSRQSMKRRLQEYTPKSSSIDMLERVDEKYHLIVFSAQWCSDCVAYVPGLAKSLIIAKNNMLQARVVDYDAYRDMAEELNIRAVPTIVVYDRNWKEVGRFIETPKKFGTVEEELCAILESRGTPKN
jgi:thiol-disulfide isomerase/thioredoxin